MLVKEVAGLDVGLIIVDDASTLVVVEQLFKLIVFVERQVDPMACILPPHQDHFLLSEVLVQLQLIEVGLSFLFKLMQFYKCLAPDAEVEFAAIEGLLMLHVGRDELAEAHMVHVGHLNSLQLRLDFQKLYLVLFWEKLGLLISDDQIGELSLHHDLYELLLHVLSNECHL